MDKKLGYSVTLDEATGSVELIVCLDDLVWAGPMSNGPTRVLGQLRGVGGTVTFGFASQAKRDQFLADFAEKVGAFG